MFLHAVTDGLGNPVKQIMADTAYDFDKFREQIIAQGAIATLYDKLAVRFLSFIHGILIWLL